MKLWAISDLHVGHAANRRAVENIAPRRDDWLILAGDVCETLDALGATLDLLCPRFAQLVWVPGNHELWTMPDEGLRGDAKYGAMVEACRRRGVLTPEDDYPIWQGEGGPHVIAPLFLLYDYSFAPPGMSVSEALAWAKEAGLECVDERVLHPDPYPSRQAWCAARCTATARRLDEALSLDLPMVLINHFPLLESHAMLPLIPRFKIWCGTRISSDWHARYRADVVVYGHLHLRTTRIRDATRFEEVSLGYPRQWDDPVDALLRQILPHPPSPFDR